MTTTWTISTLERETSNGFVTTAHWQATAVDGEHTASIYSTCSWADGTPTIPNLCQCWSRKFNHFVNALQTQA
jgi:hypothetical protein